ncbi:MAG: hypothetical protein IJ849_10005 [Selenomonadaceae bacterium]|nr:hypothetical protein [Selenomonadaceae bacterium]
MVERIERVARVNGISYGAYRPFERKEGYRDKERQKPKFSGFLRHALGGEPEDDGSYRLDIGVGRATQSLFYRGDIDLRPMQERMNLVARG